MTTAAAIDRLIHYAVILEVTGTSYRTGEAKEANGAHWGSVVVVNGGL